MLLIEHVITTTHGHQLIVGSNAIDTALVHHNDLISIANGGEAVGDHQQGLASRHLSDVVNNLTLGVGIQSTCGLIKDDHFGIAENHPRQSDALHLAAAELPRHAVRLVDEPLGALDAKLRKSMQIELKHVHDNLGITFIYVTHDQEEALVMSDRIAVMSGGRIVQLGRPDDIFERPRNRFVAEFIGTANFLSGRMADARSGAHRIALAHGPVWTTTALTDAVPGDAVTVAVRPQKIRVASPHGAAEDGPNSATAILREIIYVGAWIRLIVELAPGVTLAVENASDSMPFDYRKLRPGSELSLQIPPDALIVLRD